VNSLNHPGIFAKDDGIAEFVSVGPTALCNAVFGGEDARDCEEVTEDAVEWKRFLEFLGRPKSVCVQGDRAGLSLVKSEGAAFPGQKAFIGGRSAQTAVMIFMNVVRCIGIFGFISTSVH
jgi:hypothetical protein